MRREGITLLRNKDHVLPIDCTDKRKKIVVLGYLADCENIGDRGSSQVYAPYIITLLQGLTQYWSKCGNRLLRRRKSESLQKAGKGGGRSSDRGRK